MPNVKRLLTKQGTTFNDAVDSFPLCCPARATFITGQYAHNHGVASNFWPYGWNGMKNRANILPSWLQKVGYKTALIGKWLNGYGSLDAHGEVPKGFDIWRGLLDASAYDYYNYVMNKDGDLTTWGDADFARKLVEFSHIQVIDNEAGASGVFRALSDTFGPGPYTYWGTQNPEDYSPDVTGGITEELVRSEKSSKKPFFIWWAPAAPHREDVATTLMGRPGRDPRPAPRYEQKSKQYKLPRPPSFNEKDVSDKPLNLTSKAPLADPEADRPAPARLRGPHRLAAGRRRPRQEARRDPARRPGQLKNTLIVFLSDNGWLQGQHRIPGDKFLPYEESLRIPLILRGPGVPAGRDRARARSPTSTSLRRCSTRPTRAPGGCMDGVSLLPTIRNPRKRPNRAHPDRGDRSALPRATSRRTSGTGPTTECAPTATPTSSYKETGDAGAVRPAQGPVPAEATS